MPLLFSMSLAGSLPLLLCVLIILFRKESVNFLLINGLLKLSIFFFLIPVQLVRLIHPVVPDTITWYLDDKLRFYTKDGLFLLPFYLVLLGVIIICVLFIFCIFETVQYRRALTVLLKTSIPLPEGNASKSTSVYLNPTLTTPCTVGFFHCRIFLPSVSLSDSEENWLLTHEKKHISRKDSFFKLLCTVCLCLHWYNPISWLLLPLYQYCSECSSDAAVIKDMSQEQKRAYAQLLIEHSSAQPPLPFIWKNNFASSSQILKRRILIIMKNSHTNSRLKTPLLLVLCLLLCSTTTTFAYTPMEKMDSSFLPPEDENVTYVRLTDDPEAIFSEIFPYGFADFSSSSSVIVLEDGTQVDYDESDTTRSPQRQTCQHTFVKGQQQRHLTNSSGGCTITMYTLKRCSKCGLVKDRVKAGYYTFPKCTHKK